MLITQLEGLSSLFQIKPKRKARFDNQLKHIANRVLDIYLKKVDIIPEVCEKLHAMRKAIGFKLEKLVESDKVMERRKVPMEETDASKS